MNQTRNPLIALGAVLFFMITSCEKDKSTGKIDYQRIKEIAWNSLTPKMHENVLHDWQDAEATVEKNPDNIVDDIVIVIFHTPDDILTFPIAVYVDMDSEGVIYPENIPLCL